MKNPRTGQNAGARVAKSIVGPDAASECGAGPAKLALSYLSAVKIDRELLRLAAG